MKIKNGRTKERKNEGTKKAKNIFVSFLIFWSRGSLVLSFFSSLVFSSSCFADDAARLNDLPPLPENTYLFTSEKMFGYRGKLGGFMLPPSRVGAYFDKKAYYKGTDADEQSMKVMYKKTDKASFCGAYVILLADLSGYKTMSFFIKGQKGGESFELGVNDVISNKREDAVYVGSINRYLEAGVTTDWQEVSVPLSDFFGPDISKVYSLIFHFNDIGEGAFWIDELKFSKEDPIPKERQEEIKKKGFFLLDDFDSSNLNLLGRKANAYKKLPSVCTFERTSEEYFGPRGRALKLNYKKESTGWCGYYTLLNQIDGEYYNLKAYKSVSFIVKGKRGGEEFELGMADRNWIIIGDSLKAGSVKKYLPGGVTTKWQEVVLPLEDFGLLDLSEMGSFVINFYEKGEGTIYIDDLKFYLKNADGRG